MILKQAESRLAFILEQVSRAGLVVLAGTFVIYALRWVEPSISFSDLPAAWALPAKELLAIQKISPRWGWLRELRHSDVLCLLGPVLLGLSVIAAYAGMIPLLFEKGRRRYLFFVLIQLGILVLAMSGFVGVEG